MPSPPVLVPSAASGDEREVEFNSGLLPDPFDREVDVSGEDSELLMVQRYVASQSGRERTMRHPIIARS
jgi:hypothetical protein